MFLVNKWRFHGFVNTHTIPRDSKVNSFVWEIQFFASGFQWHLFAVYFNESYISLIFGLFFDWYPTAIFGTVISVHINSLDAQIIFISV